MCSIMAWCSDAADMEKLMEGFDRTVSRGPDHPKVMKNPNGIMGFHRLAIMGLTEEGMQPFSRGDSQLICNGEIYGFRKIKEPLETKGYTFQRGSDCEILLPLYEQFGTKMFAMLDAEYALVLYDGETGSYLSSRDPIGIRPLYYC